MPYCPNCGAEYVEGKRWCKDCAVELVSEPPEGTPPGIDGQHLNAAELCQVNTQAELELVERQLRAAGIPTAKQARNIAIYVPEEQLEHARRVLTGEGGKPLFDTVGLSEMNYIRLTCSRCDKHTSFDVLSEEVPVKCECGHYFDLTKAKPIIDRYADVVRMLADKDFEIELELPTEGAAEEEAEEEEE